MLKFVFSFCFFFTSLFGAFIGNAYDPAILQRGFFVPDTSRLQVKAKGVFDYIGSKKYLSKDPSIYNLHLQSISEGAGFILNFWERVETYAFFLSQRTNAHFSHRLQKKSITPKGILYCGGAKIDLIEIKHFFIGFDVKYLYWKGKTYKQERLRQQEWQITSQLMYRNGYFYPYIGISVDGANLRLKNIQNFPISRIQADEKNHVGLVVGSSLSSGKYASITLEGRFFQETACSFFFTLQL